MFKYTNKTILLLLIIMLFSLNNYSQLKKSYYEFNFIDGKNYVLTMNQSNDLMLNSLRSIDNLVTLKTFNRKKKKLISIHKLYSQLY